MDEIRQINFLSERGDLFLSTASSSDEHLCYGNDTCSGKERSDDLVLNEVDEYGFTFWSATVLILLATFVLVGTAPVVDATALGVLGKEDRHKHGLQRVWGSVGYAFTSLTIGYLKDRSASHDTVLSRGNEEFLSMFLGGLIMWICAAAVSAKLPIKSEEGSSKVRLKDVKTILKNPKTTAFYGILFFYGFDVALQEIFLFWFAEEKLNASAFVLGTSTSIGSFVTIPFCLISGHLIKRFGHTALICFGMTALAVRTSAPAWVADQWQLIGTESLRGITWGLTNLVVCSYTSKISPAGLEHSTMGITQGYIWGFSYGVGAISGGLIYHSMGGDFLFMAGGLLTAAATAMFAIYTVCSRHNKEVKSTVMGEETVKLKDIQRSNEERNVENEIVQENSRKELILNQ